MSRGRAFVEGLGEKVIVFTVQCVTVFSELACNITLHFLKYKFWKLMKNHFPQLLFYRHTAARSIAVF